MSIATMLPAGDRAMEPSIIRRVVLLAALHAAYTTAPPASRSQSGLRIKNDDGGREMSDRSAPSCPVVEHANNVASMLPADPNTSTTVVKHLGIIHTEAECRVACENCGLNGICPLGTSCQSWTWHHTDFPGAFAGHCYARLDDHWPPKVVGKPVSSQWMGERAQHCEPFVPGSTPHVQFSWDTVPVFFHSDNVTGPFTDEAIEFLARSFAMVTIEKYQGPNAGGQNKVWRPQPGPVECCEEDRIAENFRRLKAINSNVTTILYLNSLLDFPQYRLHALLQQRPDLWLNSSDGLPVLVGGDGHPRADLMAYDMRKPEVANLFKQACLNYTKDGTVDGCFIDRAIDGLDSAAYNGTGMLEAHVQMMKELQNDLGHQPLIANHAYNLSHVNSAQIEAGGPNAYSMNALLDAAANNKLVQFHVEYGYPNGPPPNFANSYDYCSNTTMFTDALATFLIGAGEHAYFGCFPWHSIIGWPELKEKLWHEEYDRPLGQPRGPAVLDGKTWRREFSSGTVVTLCCKGDALYSGHIDWGTFVIP